MTVSEQTIWSGEIKRKFNKSIKRIDMHTFYYEDLPESGLFDLPEEESRHCTKVLRMQEGDRVRVVDGKGAEAVVQLHEVLKKKVVAELVELKREKQKGPFLHIAIAPTKNMDRMEWFVEKATEIGVDKISFIRCRYSERKELKMHRLEKIAVSAMKQSKRVFLPQLEALMDFDAVLADSLPQNRFIAYCPVDTTESLTTSFQKGEDIFVLIGPEGDFSDEEVEKALAAHCKAVSLGKARLRTETAGIVACHTFNLKNQ